MLMALVRLLNTAMIKLLIANSFGRDRVDDGHQLGSIPLGLDRAYLSELGQSPLLHRPQPEYLRHDVRHFMALQWLGAVQVHRHS